MKQPKVFAPDVPPPAPPLSTGPRYRYFSKPPTTVTVKLGDLAAQIPPEARTSLFDHARTIELPTESILPGPVPKIRLSRLAETAPEAFTKIDDVILRLPVARLAVNYKFVHSQELIEDKPLPPLEPLISAEGSFIPDSLSEDFAPFASDASIEDVPPEDFAPPTPEIVSPAPAAFKPAPTFTPQPPIAPFTPPPPVAEPPAAEFAPPLPPAPAPEPAKPQGKKVFSILPMFRRKEPPPAPADPVIPPVASPESRPRVEIPKPRTVLPPITARVAEAVPVPPPAPVFEPEPTAEAVEVPPFIPAEEAPVEPVEPVAQAEEPRPVFPEPEPEPPATPEAVWVETEHFAKSQPNPSAEIPDQDGLQAVFMTEEYLSLERVIALSGGLPGIKSCVLSQGRAVLGSHNAPDNIDLVSLSANAVEMLHAMRQSAAKMGVGAIPAVTIHSDKGPITFFHQEDLCLLVMHKDRGFVPGVREKLQQVVRELSRANLTLPVAPAKPSLGE